MSKHAITLASCKCRSAWCENTFCRSSAVESLYKGGRTGTPERWDWRKVRHFWLTVDRSKFADGEDAYESTKGDISYLMQKIRREISDRGLVVVDYLKVLEWHEDGFPHWHYLVLMNKGGRKAQIGYDVIDASWDNGLVQERYIQDEGHWAAMVGYQAKQGYIGKAKEHQVTLPDWALDRESGTIRKGSRAHRKRCGTTDEGSDDSDTDERESKDMKRVEARNDRKTYRVRLKDCDKGSRLLDFERKVCFSLPLSASDVRDTLLPDMMQHGDIYAESYTENKGYVILFETPDRVTSKRHAMDVLWSRMVRSLERLSGEDFEPGWEDRVRGAMAQADAAVLEGV